MLRCGIKQIYIKHKRNKPAVQIVELYTLIKCQQMHLINNFTALSSPTVDGKSASWPGRYGKQNKAVPSCGTECNGLENHINVQVITPSYFPQ